MDSLFHEPLFKFSWIGAPFKFALEVDADLVEWPLNMSVLIPDLLSTFFSHPDTVEETTGLCGLKVLNKSWEWASFARQSADLLIYSSRAFTTHKSESSS